MSGDNERLPVAAAFQRTFHYRPHKACVCRWIQRGVGGHRLNALRIGAQWTATVADVRDFVERTQPGSRQESAPRPRQPDARAKAAAAAEAELDRAGF